MAKTISKTYELTLVVEISHEEWTSLRNGLKRTGNWRYIVKVKGTDLKSNKRESLSSAVQSLVAKGLHTIKFVPEKNYHTYDKAVDDMLIEGIIGKEVNE